MAPSEQNLPQHITLRWWIAVAVIVTAATIGGIGIWKYDTQHRQGADILSVAYHTLQLFFLGGDQLDHPVNWQIHVGRWLGALILFWAAIRGLTILFRSELQLCWTKFRGGHVIVCGLGRLGRQLAKEFKKRGTRVVVIEADPKAAEITGIPVVSGDAAAAEDLRRAGITRAKQLIAVCDDVQTNVAVVASAGQVLREAVGQRGRSPKLEGWLFVPDANLRQLFKRELFPHTGAHFQVNVRGLDLFSLAARQALAANPLDYAPIAANSDTTVHLVIVGFGAMGQHLALQAAHIGHFANYNSRKPRITVLDRLVSGRAPLFLERYPQMTELMDWQVHDFSPDAPDAAKQILRLITSDSQQLVTVALCWDSQKDIAVGESELLRRLERDDAINLRLALSLHQTTGCGMPRTIIFQTRRSGFAALFQDDGRADSWGTVVRVFGMIEDTCSLDALMHESTDAVARILHEDWYCGQKAVGRKDGDKPALWPWDLIDEMYKESNRHAADHIPVKMRAIGYTVEKLRKNQHPITTFTAPQIELLAEMEHRRWCSELFLLGYSHAPGSRNDTAKTHPDLVSWQELTDDGIREYDRGQVRAIPAALRKAGLGIYVDHQRTPAPSDAPVLVEQES